MRWPLINLFFLWMVAIAIGGCGSGENKSDSVTGEARLVVSGAPAVFGVFDASLTEDGSTLWMSYSAVNGSPNDPVLLHVSTRIASSVDGGQTWTDAGIALNTNQDDLIVPGAPAPSFWVAWEHEVSRLVYDPFDSDANRRWKIMWHRYRTADVSGTAVRLFQHGWMSYATAPGPTGPWTTERKLFVGSSYDSANDAVIGPPEHNLATEFAGLSGCNAFTEPGLLATASGTYISLHCAGASGKIVMLRCTGDFGAGNCTYRGDLLAANEAQSFALTGETYTGFSASEIISAAGKNYLIVSPTSGDDYRGCLVFEVDNLDAGTLVRSAGQPVWVKRVGGSSSIGFHGACAFTAGASVAGIVYGKAASTANPPFQMFRTGYSIP